jgi:hypothetical protein
VAAPWFVLVAAGVWGAGTAIDLRLPILSILVALTLAGFYGTEWVFYFRRLTGRDLLPHEVPREVWGYIGRFVRLGLIVFVPMFVIGVVTAVATVHGTPAGDPAARVAVEDRWRVIFISYELIVDVLLTFVSPALVYSTTSAREALAAGISRLRRTLPSSALYALTPGLSLSLVAFVLPRSALGDGGTIGLAVGGGLLGLAFKGAIAPFYLRSLSDSERKAGLADP